MSRKRYVLDANVFIAAARGYYAFDILPSFWQSLVDLAHEGSLCSIDRVSKELGRQADALAEWAAGPFSGGFASTDDSSVIARYSQLQEWVANNPQFKPAAKSEFADSADAWLVAYALAMESTVVSQEVARPAATSRIKIPDVCATFAVPCCTTFTMLRELHFRA